MWHRPSAARLRHLREKAFQTCNVFDLGAYLHALQDSYLHGQFDERWGHWDESAADKFKPGDQDPDSWYNPANRCRGPKTVLATASELAAWHEACAGRTKAYLKGSHLWTEYQREFPR